MSEPFKIRVGSKSNKGTLKSENDDRILIGMDPAANDWLFSPDPVQVGEFGTVLLIADGLGDNENGGFAANSICKTIKKLFDETLELPPYDDEKLRLLIKFFQIAQKQLHTQSLEHPAYKNIGASATLVLLLDNKAFIVWLGNCRAYRYHSKGVDKTFFTDLPNLELLTIDHTFETEKALFDDYREEKYFYPSGISKYVSSDIISYDISGTIVSLKKLDRILICSEGLFSALSNENIQDILSSSVDPEISTDVLISRAFNNGTEKNISAIVVDILEERSGIPKIENSEIQPIEKARSLYGMPIANVVLPSTPKETPATQVKKEKKISPAEDLVPVKLRTVMPEPDPDSPAADHISGKEEITDKHMQSGEQIAIEWPEESQEKHTEQAAENEEIEAGSEDKISDEIADRELSDEYKDDSIIPTVSPEAPSTQIQGEMAERLARLKIKMTVYPDADDKTPTNDDKNPTNTDSSLSPNDDEDKDSSDFPELNELIGETQVNDKSSDFKKPSEDHIIDDIAEEEHEAELNNIIESDIDQQETFEIPEPFERAILPLSTDFVIDLQEDPSFESNEDENNAEFNEELPELSDIERIESNSEENEKVVEDYESEEFEQKPEAVSHEIFSKPNVSESPEPDGSHIRATVHKPIAHLIGTEKDDNKTDDKERKFKLWPYYVVLGLLILIPIWICRDNSGQNSDNSMNGDFSSVSSVDENTDIQAADNLPVETEPEPEPEDIEEEEAEVVNPPATSVPDPETEKPKEKKKEEAKPKSDSRQPIYDAEVEKNKHQLLGEVQALLQQKNQLCRQISTYGKNAPQNKSESIKQVQNKCDQLDQKFSSIYDQKSGYFKTVRYDFMKGTIKSIRVSMEQIEQQFGIIRSE